MLRVGSVGWLCALVAALSSVAVFLRDAPSVPDIDSTHYHVTAISPEMLVWVESLDFVVSPQALITNLLPAQRRTCDGSYADTRLSPSCRQLLSPASGHP